ncbi:MAG TPA: PilN domain-containing protein, partial [Afifellaceae bacterium]|nr:PilN domain-containing protein [Afifellaceae bacterium]
SLGEAESALAQVADLRRLKTERPPLIGVIDELTRLLPDEAWVRYFRIEGDVVDVTIVAPKTAELLPILGRSSMFGAASLSAPVTYDEAGKSERAAVRVRLRPPAREVGAAAADGSPG